jgi:hypothetical protein
MKPLYSEVDSGVGLSRLEINSQVSLNVRIDVSMGLSKLSGGMEPIMSQLDSAIYLIGESVES